MTVIVFSMKFSTMDSTRVISLMLLLSVTRFDNQCGVAEGCKIKESSILLNFQKGDNIISKLINKFVGKKTDENRINEKISYTEAPSVASSYMYPTPAQEDVQAPYQYYYLPYQPTPVFPYEETTVAPPLPQQTFYTNSPNWPSVNVEKDVNINKDVKINEDLSVSSRTDAIPPQLPTYIHGKDHGSPIYSTSIVINNEPKQVIPPPPAALPNDATRRECNDNCHLHITHGHHDITPYHNNGNSQSNPSHPPSVYPVQPSPVYTNPPFLPYPAPAIQPTVSHNSHFDVGIHRVPENKQTDLYLPVYASSQPPEYLLPVPPVTPPIYNHNSRFNANIPIVPENREDITPYPNNGISQSNPTHPPSVYPVQPSPVYTNLPTLPYPAPAPQAIQPTVSHNSHFDVGIHRVPENKQTDLYLPVYTSPQPSKYPLPVPPVTPPIFNHDSRFNANIPIVSENRETNQNPISSNHQPIYIQNDPRLRPHFVQHQNPPQIQQGQDYSSHSSMHHQLVYEASRPSNPTNKYPQTKYENDKPITSELSLSNKQGQPTIIEREKTSTVIVETQPRSDIPDTSIEYRSAEEPPRIEGGYRLMPVRSRIVEHPPLHHAGGEFHEKNEFSRSGTYMTDQERQIMPQVSYADSSLLASTNHFEESKAKSSSISNNRFRSQ